MRVLFSCTAGDGHFLPLLPLAQAAAAAGHDVAFATASDLRPRIEAAGLEALAAGMGNAEARQRYHPVQEALDLPSVPIDRRRELVYRARFAQVEAPTKLGDLRRVAHEWQPDIVVHESCELAAPIVATELGVPSVHHSFGRVIPQRCIAGAAEEIGPLWESAGLEPDAHAGLYRGTYVDICPPSLQDEPPPAGTRVQRLRPADGRREERDGRPLVYVTLGTVFNQVERFRELLAAVAPVDCDVILTAGRDVDLAELEPIPPNADVHAYVPQAEILPRADVVIGHGGSGSTWGALAHGCALVVLPQAADQFENAAAVHAAGAGIALLPGSQDEGSVRDALERVLADTSHAEVAATLADEIGAMPTAEQAAAQLFAA